MNNLPAPAHIAWVYDAAFEDGRDEYLQEDIAEIATLLLAGDIAKAAYLVRTSKMRQAWPTLTTLTPEELERDQFRVTINRFWKHALFLGIAAWVGAELMERFQVEYDALAPIDHQLFIEAHTIADAWRNDRPSGERLALAAYRRLKAYRRECADALWFFLAEPLGSPGMGEVARWATAQ